MNNRIYYAVQAVKMKPCQTNNGGVSYTYGTERVPRGVQSVGITTNFNLEQAYQLGQVDIYENIEEVPDVEVTISKVFDGTRTLYNLANDGNVVDSSNGLGLTQISDRRCDLALGIWDDTKPATSGSADYYVVCTGMYVSSVTYNFVVDGNFSEDLTLVGNHKKWGLTGGSGIGGFASGIVGSGQDYTPESATILRRWTLDKSNTVLPTGASGGIPGDFASGLHINSITLSTSLGRESINELGRRSPYYRYISFPVEVTAEIEVTAVQSDNVDADDFSDQTGCAQAASANLTNKTIKIALCNGNTANAYVFDLGAKNKLTSVNYTGGDTGGGNVTTTYSYQTFNSFSVTSPNYGS